MEQKVFEYIISSKKQKKKLFAVLIDPDKFNTELGLQLCNQTGIDLFFVGGSLLSRDLTRQTVRFFKQNTQIPVVIFPGNSLQVCEDADALLFLSLISGRNPDLLIGQHVAVASQVKQMQLETIPTGYMLIDSGKPTSALYMSQTNPIPADKPDIAAATAMAGELLGLKVIYMDGGSGAQNPISQEIIQEVASNVELPLIIGGGINTPEKVELAYKSGADIVVVGNKIEQDPSFVETLTKNIGALNLK